MKLNSKNYRTSMRQGWLSVIPALLVILAIRGYPLVVGLIKSFTNWNGMSQSDFIGFKNYINILTGSTFWTLIANNFIYMLFIPVQILIGVVVAILFYERTWGWKFFQSVFYLPQMLSSVVVGYLFTVFFGFRGPINSVLDNVGLGSLSRDWLGSRVSAIVIIMICLVWINIGWQALLALGGLASISSEVFEAAKIDGAGYWSRLFYITLPLLGRTIEYSCVISVIWVLTGLFPFVFSMTGGGPGYGTATIDYVVYLKSFSNSSQMGYACALAVILMVIVMLLTIGQMKLSNRANDWE